MRSLPPKALNLFAFVLLACASSNVRGPRNMIGDIAERGNDRCGGCDATDVLGPVSVEQPTDWIVWYESAGGTHESAWVKAQDAGFEVVATVGAAVVSDGAAFWRLARTVQHNPRRAMDCVEEELIGPTVDVTTVGIAAFDEAGRARELVASPTLASAAEHATAGTTLIGSLGPHVSYAYEATATNCGQVGDWGWTSGSEVVSVVTGVRSDPVRVGASERAMVEGEVAKELEALRDCAYDEDIAKGGEAEGWSVAVKGGALVVTFRSGISVAANCDHSEHYTIETPTRGMPDGTGLGRAVPAGLAAFLKTLPDGPIGISRVSRAQADALARFRALPANDWFESAEYPGGVSEAELRVAPLIEAGRKATAAGDLAAARDAFSIALARHLAPTAFSGRGYAALLAKDYTSAAEDFLRALEGIDDPAVRAAIWFNLGQVERARGDIDAARRALQRSLGNRPNPAVAKALADLPAPAPTPASRP